MFHEFYPVHQVYIQDTNYSCGPAAIINVLRLKKNNAIPKEKELCRICETNAKTGTLPEGMFRGIDAAGLKVVEAKENGSIKEIKKHLDNGAWVIVNYMHLYAGCGHYGVVTAYDEDAIYLMDSSFGLLRLDYDEFEPFWYDKQLGNKKYFIAVK